MAAVQDETADQQPSAHNSHVVFGLVPERHILHREVLDSLKAHFWQQPVESARSLNGLVSVAPAEPCPLPLQAPSGLSRTQFLIAAQALKAPAFPSLFDDDGGLVLDRVLIKAGNENWWSAMTGRLKIQRIFSQRQHLKQAVTDPRNYALGCETKARIGRSQTVRVKVETQRPEALSGSPIPWVSAHSQLRRKLQASELHMDVALNQMIVDGVRGHTVVPACASVDIGTLANHTSALQYRLGIQQVLAPGPSPQHNAAGTPEDDNEPPATSRTMQLVKRMQQLKPAAWVQGAVALQGEATLWKGAKARQRHPQSKQEASGCGSSSSAALQPAASSAAAGQAADAGAGSSTAPASKAFGTPHNPLRSALRILNRLQRLTGAGAEDQGEGFGDGYGSRSRKHPLDTGQGSGALPDPGKVQELLLDATQSISQLREDVQGLESWVASGSITRALIGKKGRSWLHGPWSIMLPQPHLKAAGMLGIIARRPLLPLHGASPADVQGSSSAAAETSAAAPAAPTDRQQLGRVVHAEGTAAAHRVAAVCQHLMKQAGQQIMLGAGHLQQDVELRPWGTGGVELQLGHFQRSFLDFTRLMARLDLGLTAPKQAAPAGSTIQRSIHPACALGGHGAWHALTLSVCQQLLGPVRVCADLRYSLESSEPLKSLPSRQLLGREHAINLVQHVQGMRPMLLDAVYGLDVVLPGTSGMVRLAAWYTPKKKEGMLQLRLF